MHGIKPIKSLLYNKVPVNRVISQKGNLYSQSRDTFVRSDLVKSVASDFREKMILPFANWDETFPADGEDGADLLKSLIIPYQKTIEKFSKHDAEIFTRLVFGEKHIMQMEKAAYKNSDVRSFKQTLEKILEKDLANFYPKN